MDRWAALCAQLPVLPPHPQQLGDLLGMSLLKVRAPLVSAPLRR
jgi:hypothetical protein